MIEIIAAYDEPEVQVVPVMLVKPLRPVAAAYNEIHVVNAMPLEKSNLPTAKATLPTAKEFQPVAKTNLPAAKAKPEAKTNLPTAKEFQPLAKATQPSAKAKPEATQRREANIVPAAIRRMPLPMARQQDNQVPVDKKPFIAKKPMKEEEPEEEVEEMPAFAKERPTKERGPENMPVAKKVFQLPTEKSMKNDEPEEESDEEEADEEPEEEEADEEPEEEEELEEEAVEESEKKPEEAESSVKKTAWHASDEKLQHLQAQIEAKQQYLAKKKQELSNTFEQNAFLQSVRKDYRRYEDYIVQQKQAQLDAFATLKQHLEQLANTGELSEQNARDAKVEQKAILKEIDSIKAGLEQLMADQALEPTLSEDSEEE